MNKKFSTLMASLLLAGSAFSVANATGFATLAGNGKYYKIQRSAYYTKSSAAWTTGEAGYFLNDEANKSTNVTSKIGLYTIIENEDGTVSLKTFDGTLLKVAGVSSFVVSYKIDSSKPGNRLWKNGENSKTLLGTDDSGNLEIVDWNDDPDEANKGTYGYAVQEVGTDLEQVTGYDADDIDDGYTFRFVIQKDGEVTVSDEMYKAVVNETTGTVSFVEIESGDALEIGGASNFTLLEVGDDVVLQVSDNSFVKYDGTSFSLVSSLAEATIVAFKATGSANVDVDQLNFFAQNGFSVTVKGKATNGKYTVTLSDNPFTGHLIPMTYSSSDNGSFSKAADSETSFYLKNEAGKYIVAKRYSGEGTSASQALYKFVTVAEKDLISNLQRADKKLETRLYYGLFSADASEAVLTEDDEKLQYIDHLYVNEIPADNDGTGVANVGQYNFNGTPTLAASISTGLKPIQIKLGSSQLVNVKKFLQKGKFYTIEKVIANAVSGNGKLAVKDGNDTEYVKSYGNVLEGQFAATYDENNDKITFTNRENLQASVTFEAHALYVVDGVADTYRYGAEATQQEDKDGNALVTTYEIKAVASHAATDGYITLPQTNTNRVYNIGYSSNVFGNNAYMTENHDDDTAGAHIIGLDTDVDAALQFSAYEWSTKAYKKRQDDHTDKYFPTDSIYVISHMDYWNADDEEYQKTADTLKVVSYSFVNQWNEPLVRAAVKDGYAYQSLVTYTDGGKTYKYANATSEKAYGDADQFALRKDGSKLNLRLVNLDRNEQSEADFEAGKNYQVFQFGNDAKVYAGDAANGILDVTSLYDRTENDLFVVEETSKAIYRSLEGANANGLDTISIYRDENNKSLLYEKTVTLTADNDKVVNFLGMENIADFTKMAPAMLADIAYVRYETYMPQYLLVVDPTIVPAGKWCDVHQTADCEHAVPTKGLVSGRFLVSLADTAAVWADANKHKAGNPYLNSENLPKLGFVQATHYNDTLAITREKPTAADSLYLGDNKFNVAKFAFKYVDTESKSFLIETKGGFLKWMNGYVVVVLNEKDADIFNMNEDEDRNPTANEAIEAAGVQVIAGKGTVTVQGAAGKVITVADILGRTIANQVAASDNVTIAAPAGVVVVAVEGEATKVVVK